METEREGEGGREGGMERERERCTISNAPEVRATVCAFPAYIQPHMHMYMYMYAHSSLPTSTHSRTHT
jgi:hypothetical protein